FNLAYYPSERGPYNYNVNELKADGTLENPEDKWGGVMRRLETTDFEANNIEYIEFWLMDPFLDPDDDGPLEPINKTGGRLVFNLGDISEDILKDGRKSYEQGLPVSDNITKVDTTIWGRVPSLQALVSSFDSDPASRPYQDVGYDGLNSTREGNNDEYTFFKESYIDKIVEKFGSSVSNAAYANAISDPSADDFHYFRGTDFDGDATYSSILMRYKNFNGPEGNSCAQELSPESYDISATSVPNMEDINNDNTLSESEKFYEYIVNLTPNGMVEGENYITEIYTATNISLENGTRSSVKWYQFKIPINQPDRVQGNISDYTSIRFMRTYLTAFEEPIVLRFGTFELVKGDWRRYESDLLAPGEYIPTNSANRTAFDISTVSVEENSSSTARVPYTTPPDVIRERDYTTTNQAQQDEQSLCLKVSDLYDGDARGAYKTCSFDFRNYNNLEMYVHAHANTEDANARYANVAGAVTVFIRFGSDFTNNYYEYEVPVIMTPWGVTTASDNLIWMDDNKINIEFDKLIQVKNNRKLAMDEENSTVSITLPYTEYDGKNKISIVGTPSTSTVEAIMIGVRNPKKTSSSINDDGLPMSVTVWLDELRLTNFNENSGWAATASLSGNLADFGNYSVSGTYSTPGFGSIETNVNERSQETVSNIYTSLNLELGKFLPNTGIKVPMHFDYSTEVATPEYDPLDPDVYLKDQFTLMSGEEKKEYKKKTQDITQKTNVNFVNVRKERTGNNTNKPHFWDIENFDVSYSYSKTHESDIDIEYYDKIIHTAGLGYTYAMNPKNVKPFAKIKFLKYKPLALIRDFNFYYLPKTLTFRTTTDKNYLERLIRNKTGDDIIINPTVSKQWNWNRNYVFKYDLASSLKFDYAANASSYIDEPAGLITDKAAYKQYVWNSVKDFGRMNTFNQTAGINWTVPINKIPLLGWINMTAKYDASLYWRASASSIQEQMGNTIENSGHITLNTSFKLSSIYSKIPYVKDLAKSSKSKPKKPVVTKGEQSANDSTMKKKSDVNIPKLLVDGALKIIFGLKDVSISYQNTGGTILPGFYPEPNNFGYNWGEKAPTWGFILGSQKDIRPTAVSNGWLTTDTLNNNLFSQTSNTNINYRGNYEPFNGFRIEITGSYRESSTNSEIFKADGEGNFNSYSPINSGSYQISYLLIRSAFGNKAKGTGDDDGAESSVFFETLKNYRTTTATRLANQNPNWNGEMYKDTTSGQMYPVGYGPSQQEVVMSAFLAAYSGIDPAKISLTAFPQIPLPNWNIQYSGLSKIGFLKDVFRSITLRHKYSCTYNVGSYTTNLYYESLDGYPSAYDYANNFISDREVSTVQISEQFSPLIGLDVIMQNSFTANVQIRKTRTMTMSFTNNQLTDNSSDEYVFGVGYRFKDVKFTVRSVGGRGKKTDLKSDINLKLDFSIRNSLTVLRRLDEDINQISAGQDIYSINVSADYMVSRNLTIAFYYDQTINDPKLSTSVYNSTLSAGISLRMTLSE
ncbi:MAG: cell surface protein SprA, partial [Bacteroidales bacterium]|nr:cell surface protein SprA [Bacteroidales bacterium]